jgi:hypothetical protein
MIFESLHESSRAGELILIDGGYCRWHLRRDGIVTIYEIISQRPGAGSAMLAQLQQVAGAVVIQAKCPENLPANDWYRKKGFICMQQETTRSGRVLNVWRLPVSG